MHSSVEGQKDIPYTSEGYLIVNTVAANEALPIENARVFIKGNDEQNKDDEFVLFTNESGLTELIALKTPEKELSLSPGNAAGYSSYNISVSKDGYYSRKFSHIPIFSGVTSLQRVNLVAKTPFDSDDFDPNGEVTETAPFDEEIMQNEEEKEG